MKKRILLLTSLTILLTSCGTVGVEKTSPKDVLTEPFSCTANIITPDIEATGTLSHEGVGCWDIEFSEPSTLSGVNLTFDGVNSEASYKGLSFSIPKDAVPINSMLLCLATAIDEISTNEDKNATSKDDILTFKGSTDCGDYVLTVDEKTGDILTFEMDNLQLIMTFSDVKTLESSKEVTSMSDEEENEEQTHITTTESDENSETTSED
ncbi:MAG: hypothetical protein ACI4WH_08710 [Oscillospiraceae bacterium]